MGNALERAREATDAANERAAKAEILICYMTDSEYAPGKKVIAIDDETIPMTVRRYYVYDVESGKLLNTESMNLGTALPKYGKCSKHKNCCLILWIDKNYNVEMVWTPQFLMARPSYGNFNLCGPTLNEYKPTPPESED